MRLVSLAILALALFVRLACLRAEFWLDEIWSWRLAHEGGVWGLFFTIKHDNNHHLNSLILWCWPPGLWWGCYRLHSLVAGVGAVALAMLIARRWSQRASLIAGLLLAVDPWLVFTSAEARGYALVVFFALAALEALWRYLDTRRTLWLVLFWVASILGFLSHLTFVHAYIGFVIWTLRRQARQEGSSLGEVIELTRIHAVPGVWFAAFYLVCLRGLELGGGPERGTMDVLASLISTGLGGPAEGWWTVPWVAVGVVAFALGLRQLAKEPGEVWVFFAVAVVASPALFLVRRPPFLFERYFFVAWSLWLLVMARAIASRGTWPAGAVVALIVVLSLWRIGQFVATGRGDFHRAVAWITEQGDSLHVSGDHDFRVGLYTEFHGEGLTYINRDDVPPEGVSWLLVHRLENRVPPDEERDRHGNVYRLVRAYPSRGRHAWGWFVYRRTQKQVRDQ